MNTAGHRQREEDSFDDRFGIGDQIITIKEKSGCSIIDACRSFKKNKGASLSERALSAAYNTALTFPQSARNPLVGYTKHQSLTEVSRKNLGFPISNEDYKRGLREALKDIHENEISVNSLNNGPDTARSVLIRALKRLKRK